VRAQQADSRIGTEVAGYRIEAGLGRGGMSVVYLAEDLRLHRKIALKLIAEEFAEDERFRDRFLAESQLAASLDHPNVVPIYEAGEAEGVLFIAMRYVEGGDVRELLENGALAPERAVDLCAQVAGALDAAHARGLVHRDVKPSNVLLDASDHAYLADFGLTRRLSDQAPAFGSNLSLGTPAYVAPEQIEGKEVDGRADQYSLACLLYECLTGAPPFRRASDAAVLFAHLDAEPPTLPNLEDVIPRALAKDPAGRFSTCREFVDACREHLGIAAPRRPLWSRAPVVAALAGVAAVTAGLLAFFLASGSSPPARSGDSLVRIDPHTRKVEARIPVGKAGAVAARGNTVWVAGKDDNTLSRIDGRTNRVELTTAARGRPADLALGPSRVVVANGPSEGRVALINAATGVQESQFAVAQGQFFGAPSVATGSSGIWVAGGDRRIGRLDVLTGELLDPIVIPQPPAEHSDAVFSGIAVGEGAVWVVGDPLEHTAWRIDESTGKVAATIPLPFAPKDVAAGAGGVWITSQLDDTLSRLDPRTNRVTATITVGKGAAGVAVGGGTVWVANAIDGTVSRVDPRTLQVESIDVGGYPEDVAVGTGAVWVAARAGEKAAPDDAFTIGVLAPCNGTYGYLASFSFAGAELPLLERGAALVGKPADGVKDATAAGKEVQLAFGCGDDSAESAVAEARRLVEVVGADAVIGTYFPGESLALRDYARKRPSVVFVSTIGAGQEVTLHNPAANNFRFMTSAAQWQAGVGRYAYRTLGWRNVVTVADVTAFNHAQIAGFVAEFCALGGRTLKQIWVPRGTSALAPYVAQVPRSGVDGFALAANTPTTLAFFKNVPQLAGSLADRLIGSIGLTVPPIPETLGRRLDGVVFGAPDHTETPTAGRYAATFKRAFPELGEAFFWNTMFTDGVEAVLRAFEAVDGDLSGSRRRFQQALASLELDTPTTGHIRLDERRQAVGPNYLIRFGHKGKQLSFKTLSVARNVEQTFGGYFRPGDPLPVTNVIPCRHDKPPPWARSR
jgi:YVTN family beta-propeller protein